MERVRKLWPHVMESRVEAWDPRPGVGFHPCLFLLRMAWMKQEISAKPSCLGSNTTYGIEKTHRSSKAFSLLSDIQRHPFFALPIVVLHHAVKTLVGVGRGTV